MSSSLLSPASLLRAGARALPVAQLGVRRALSRKSPFQVTFSLTNRCNFRCEYCDIPLQHREEMTTAEWIAAIDEFVAGGLGRASLIGGEPLLRKDAGAIIRHLRARGIHVAMNTNGWLVRDRIEDVALLDVVCVTLDGPREVHDAQRHKGSYDRVIDAIEVLRSRGVPVVTMTVITPKGAENVGHVLEVARDFGHKAFFQLEHDARCDVDAPIAPLLSDTRVADIARELRDRRRRGEPVGNSDSVLALQIRDGRRLGGDCSHCYAGRYFAYVLSDGTVAPCLLTQWQQEAGNGRKHGFLRAFEQMNPAQGPGCACVPIHEVNAILSLDAAVLFDALEIALASARARIGAAILPAG
jgi:MoaA/NifB/PqqE/SkfB family radical SAM enzyme